MNDIFFKQAWQSSVEVAGVPPLDLVRRGAAKFYRHVWVTQRDRIRSGRSHRRELRLASADLITRPACTAPHRGGAERSGRRCLSAGNFIAALRRRIRTAPGRCRSCSSHARSWCASVMRFAGVLLVVPAAVGSG